MLASYAGKSDLREAALADKCSSPPSMVADRRLLEAAVFSSRRRWRGQYLEISIGLWQPGSLAADWLNSGSARRWKCPSPLSRRYWSFCCVSEATVESVPCLLIISAREP